LVKILPDIGMHTVFVMQLLTLLILGTLLFLFLCHIHTQPQYIELILIFKMLLICAVEHRYYRLVLHSSMVSK